MSPRPQTTPPHRHTSSENSLPLTGVEAHLHRTCGAPQVQVSAGGRPTKPPKGSSPAAGFHPPWWPQAHDNSSETDASAGPRVNVQVDDIYAAEVAVADLSRAVVATLQAEGRDEAEVTVVVTSDETARGLNRQYRGVDAPTDVLSFAAQEPTPGFIAAPGAAVYLGDIVIALPFTRRQAAAVGQPLADELRLLAVHGTLHLLGYDHAEPDEKAVMWARQDAILAELAE